MSLVRQQQRLTQQREKQKMAITIDITREDLLRGEAVEKPLWLPLLIEDVGERLAKDEKSTNYVINVRVTGGEYTGKTIECIISEKGPGMAMLYRLISAATKIPIDRKNGLRGFTLESLVGKRVMGFDKPREWESRMLDSIVDWKPFDVAQVPNTLAIAQIGETVVPGIHNPAPHHPKE
jgi:hypothetical protein